MTKLESKNTLLHPRHPKTFGVNTFSTGLTRSGFSSTRAAPATPYSRPTNKSPYPRVAFPLDPGHLARENINIERAIVPDAAFLSLLGDGVMSGRHGNPKSPLIIRSERRDFRSLFVLHDESGVRERFRTGSVSSDRPGLSRTTRNHTFDPSSRSGRSLPSRNARSHNKEDQNDSELSEPHHI